MGTSKWGGYRDCVNFSNGDCIGNMKKIMVVVVVVEVG